VEEGHTNVLAGDAVQGGGRAGDTDKGCALGDGARTDVAQLAVEYGQHRQTGEAVMEGPTQRRLEGQDSLQVDTVAPPQDRSHQAEDIRGPEHGH